MDTPFAHPLGFEATDMVSGFSGTITGRADYISGCRQYCLQAPSKDGEFKQAQWFDEERLQVRPDQPGMPQVMATKTGGPSDSASAAPVR
ncbi:hypothetical protein [Paracoccus sp. SSJ]|uniref:hypothetical protein n=1 Tax=Paracoccus sp. SSJ TaxID=3050636 RepID=UPI00254FC96F|nr:hypothetical protein [Paracoccus sp. SSJ]MDK8871517.1 hypothetical protein [Paracoccus sp. SSJ]